LKAFCLAVVFVAAALPANADEMSAPNEMVLIEQSHASRLYNQQRISALNNAQTSQKSGSAELLAPHQAVVEAARTERVRKLVKAALQQVERAAIGAESVRYKIRVSCKTRRRLTRYPAVAAAALYPDAVAKPTVVASKTESCAVKLQISRKARKPDGANPSPSDRPEAKMSSYQITLPDLASAEAH